MILRNGNVFTGKGFERKDIIIEGNVIKFLGTLNEKFDEEINLNDCYVIPGMVDMSSSVGLIESGIKSEGNDLDEDSQNCIADMYAMDGINFEDRYFKEAVSNGVTHAVITSGRLSVLGAVSSLVKTSARDFSGVLKKNADISVTFGEKVKKPFGGNLSPLSRMGTTDILRKNILGAIHYKKKKDSFGIKYNEYNPIFENLQMVIEKKIPLKIYAEKKQDIENAIAIKKEFDIDVIISGGADSYKLTDLLKVENIPLILGSNLKEQSFIDIKDRRNDTAKILAENGIEFALSTHHPDITMDLLHLSMCLSCKYGLDESKAINSVTSVPFNIMGLGSERGSIEVGKIADIAIFNGNPTYSLSEVIYTIIDGEIVYKKI